VKVNYDVKDKTLNYLSKLPSLFYDTPFGKKGNKIHTLYNKL